MRRSRRRRRDSRNTRHQPAAEHRQRTNSRRRTAGPQDRTAFYRADAKPAAMPHVLLSKGDEAACKVKVAIDAGHRAPQARRNEQNETGRSARQEGNSRGVLEGRSPHVATAAGRCWSDVVEPFGKEGVAVVGVAVDESAKDAEEAAQESRREHSRICTMPTAKLRQDRHRPISANVCARPQWQRSCGSISIIHSPRAASCIKRCE